MSERQPTGRRPWRPGLIGAGLAVVVAAAGIATAGAASAVAGCRVSYTVGSQWAGGFTAAVAVTNLGDPVNGWRLGWTFPSGQRVTQAWNVTVTSAGDQVTAADAGHNAAIATNGTVSFGFNGSLTGANTAPASFSLNGVACTGAAGPASPSQTPSRTPGTPVPSTTVTTSPSTPAGTAAATVAAMQPGWNLGNSFDATGADETSWGNPRVTEALLEGIRAQGFRSVRIPVTWSAHQGAAPGYAIDAAYLARVKQVVDWALADGFYVMVDIHHDSWQWINTMPADHDRVLARYNATWTQLAAAFRAEPERLVLESVNEPQFTGSSDAQSAALLNELNTSFRTIVRNSGGTNASRLLVLPTLHTSADQARLDELASTISALRDPNIAATVHYYGYWPFSVNIAGGIRFDATAQKDVTDSLDRAAATFVNRGIPVIIGEYGLLGFDRTTGAIEQGEKLKFFEYLGYYARTRKITTMLWDNGQHFDRTTLRWTDLELFWQLQSSWTGRSGTAATDQVYSARSSAVTAKTVTLNLDGTAFQSLRVNGAELARGTDYTVTGDQLTLTAALITRLSGARAYGVNAQLSAVFSAGVPWRIDLRTYDVPQVQNATGTTAAFAVPTAFRGDQLATMEATYADGSNAGPQNWTSYKEFDRAFAPNYTGGTIGLTPDFFAEVDDGARVTLTFHFWSGAVVTYHVTRSGSAVTGTVA